MIKKIHNFITGASCTTNCLAPIVKVLKNTYTIKHGLITTIHDITNSQSIIDGMHMILEDPGLLVLI